MTTSTLFEIEIEREFEAPRTLVFKNWIEAKHLGAWFAPSGFDVIHCAVDARPGGSWCVAYRSSSGVRYTERGEFVEIVFPERLRLTLVNEDAQGEVTVRTEVQVRFEERNGRTTMRFVQTGFTAAQIRDGMQQGWHSCFDKLDGQITADRDLRILFENWFRASERKDLNASMEPIADDVLSYEHECPLEYRGIDALRATCSAGFDQMPEGFRWDVPDLQVVVRGDLAITWGLNRMRGPDVELWSRGTRVFQKIDGRWRMIHQHVSFPYDPESGAARLDLRP